MTARPVSGEMSAAVAALPAALRRLADALDDVLTAGLAGAGTARASAAAPDGRVCRWCKCPLPAGARFDAQYCSGAHRMAAHRARARSSGGQDPDPGAPDRTSLVDIAWPVKRGAARRKRGHGRVVYRGHVRWIDPATGRYRGHSRTFATQAEAWAWARAWVPASEMAPPLRAAGGCP